MFDFVYNAGQQFWQIKLLQKPAKKMQFILLNLKKQRLTKNASARKMRTMQNQRLNLPKKPKECMKQNSRS